MKEKTDQCRCCEGMHDWGRRDSGITSEHFACKFGADNADTAGEPTCAPSMMRQELADLKVLTFNIFSTDSLGFPALVYE
jgi:hypothetical protein